MTAAAAPSLQTQKRRQAVQVTFFLLGVTALTIGAFYFLRRDLVAYRRGENAVARDDFKSAAPHLEEAWQRGYRTPQVRLHLAHARLALGDRVGALELYAAALAATPGDESLIDTVAGLYQAEGKPEKGLELFARLGKPETLSAAALARLGDLKQQAGDYPGALAAYRLAAQRAPRDPNVQVRLGLVLSWMGRFDEAAAALRAALAAEPNLRVAQLQLARLQLWQGNFAEAVTEYRRVLPP